MFDKFKYRRLCSILGITLSIVISGYWLFAGILQYCQLYKVKSEIHEYLKSHIPDSLLVSFTTTQLQEPSVHFIHSKEFEQNEYKYDIVDSVETTTGFVVRCVRDDREKMVEEQLMCIYGYHGRAHRKSGKKVPDMFKYIFIENTISINAFETSPVYGSVYLARDYRYSNFVESPPPEEYDRFLILS